jgi:phosphate transport system substrate-binding protein
MLQSPSMRALERLCWHIVAMSLLCSGAVASTPCEPLPAAQRSGSVPTILPVLARRWAAAFEARHPNIKIQLPPPYDAPQGKLSSTLSQFLTGKIDFALLSRELTESDIETYRRVHGRDPSVVPVARGSYRRFGYVDTVVLVVHKDNPIPGIYFTQIDSLYSQSRLRGGAAANTWGDLGLEGSGWARLSIRALGGGRENQDDSAKAATIRSRVINAGGKAGAWRRDLEFAATGPDNVAALVAADRSAIGITALGHLNSSVRALAIGVSPQSPLIAPSRKQVSSGRYPLVRTIDLLLSASESGHHDPVLLEFARFLISRPGQKIVNDQGIFMTLDRATAQQSLRAIDRLTACSL